MCGSAPLYMNIISYVIYYLEIKFGHLVVVHVHIHAVEIILKLFNF